MSAGISFIEIPSARCVLCGDRMCSHGHTACIETPVTSGPVCSRCLWNIMQADDPHEWLVETARLYEAKVLEYQDAAERLRGLAECDLRLPSREECEEAGYGDVPF